MSWLGRFIPATGYVEGSRVVVLSLIAPETRDLSLSLPVCKIVANTVISERNAVRT